MDAQSVSRMATFNLKKFSDAYPSREFLGKIRVETLPNGNTIEFQISGSDLTSLQFESDIYIDFDKESDELIDKHKNSNLNLIFQYAPRSGFEEAGIKR